MPSKTVFVFDVHVELAAKRGPAGVDFPSAHFPLCGFFFVHREEIDVATQRQHQDLQHRLVRPEDVNLSLAGGFENDE